MTSGLILGVVLASCGIAFALPHSVGAFWPLAVSQADVGPAPLLHDASLDLLDAPLSTDPAVDSGSSATLTTSDGSALLPGGVAGSSTPAAISGDDTVLDVPSQDTISQYTVQNGDSFSGIAAKFNISVNTILWANDLTIKSTIKPGMTLVILPVSGLQHTVKSGETLSTIASKYHADASEIATFNGLDSNATVVTGSKLIIPGGEDSSISSSSSSGSSTSKPKTTTKSSTSSSSKSSDSSSSGTGTQTSTPSTSSGSSYFTDPLPGAILTQGIHGKNAVDLGAHSGTPIYAAAAGTVIVSKSDGAWNGGYGSYVVISHSNGMQTLYAHMSRDISSVGETVTKGQLIGYVGETGDATGNHLHFEVRGGTNWLGHTCTLMSACY